jgi:hypothetical protein
MNKIISKAEFEFVHDCLKRMYAVYQKYHLLYDKEVTEHEATKRELKDLKARLAQSK